MVAMIKKLILLFVGTVIEISLKSQTYMLLTNDWGLGFPHTLI
jgi:hypothetical protein